MTELGPSNNAPQTKKTKKETHVRLTTREKKIMVNVYNYLEKNYATYPYKEELYQKTANIMEVSVAIVRKTMGIYWKTGEIPLPKVCNYRKSKLSESEVSAIRKKVYQFILENDSPTLNEIETAIHNDDSLPKLSKSSLYRLIKKHFSYSNKSEITKKSVKNKTHECTPQPVIILVTGAPSSSDEDTDSA